MCLVLRIIRKTIKGDVLYAGYKKTRGFCLR